jgi:hypothetical protein
MPELKYKRCISCGNYFEITEENEEDIYCSKSCNKEYTMCMVCGNYFEPKDIINSDGFLCCKKCNVSF